MTHEEKIRELLESSQRRRLDSAMHAGETAQTLTELQQQLSAAETAYTRAYRAAVDAGWSDKELKQIGLTKPAGRPRKGPATDGPNPRESGQP